MIKVILHLPINISGYLVLMPDWYRGKIQDPDDGIPELVAFVKRETNWTLLKREWEDIVRPYAIKQGARIFGTIGGHIDYT